MKIVYISESTIPSQTANSIHVMKMCQAFAKHGHEVLLLAPKRLEIENTNNIYDYYGVDHCFEIQWIVEPSIFGQVLYAMKCLKIIKTYDPDLVYGRFIYGCSLASVSGFSTVWESHSPLSLLNFKQRLAYRMMTHARTFRYMSVISDALKQFCINDDPHIADKILVAHDGADTPPQVDPLKNEKSDRLQIGYFGHLYKGRGIDIIIQVAHFIPEADFHIVGGNEQDVKYWQNESISNNILFHGFVSPSDVYLYREKCDILLAPYQKQVHVSNGSHSTAEYMSPLKIFEYMSSKKAIVCSDLPVLREVLNEHNSILVPCDEINAWVEAIKSLLDVGVRTKIANQAFDDFSNYYSWFKRAEILLKNLSNE